AWINGAMVLAFYRFNSLGVDGRFFGIPGADILAAVVRLPDRLRRQSVIYYQEVIDVNGEELGMDEGFLLGKAKEKDAAGDFAEGVLNHRQVKFFHLPVI